MLSQGEAFIGHYADLGARLACALEVANRLKTTGLAGREVSLVITKLDEARLWLQEASKAVPVVGKAGQ